MTRPEPAETDHADFHEKLLALGSLAGGGKPPTVWDDIKSERNSKDRADFVDAVYRDAVGETFTGGYRDGAWE